MSELTFEQYKMLLTRNVLTDASLMVRNSSQPRGDLAFEVLGDNFKMKQIILPGQPAIHDLTYFAPLQNLLASSALKKLVDTHQLVILNPDDLPDVTIPLPETTITAAHAGDVVIAGRTAPNATVVIMQGENSWTGVSGVGGTFSIPVSGLVEGQVTLFVSATGYVSETFQFTIAAKIDSDYPVPTVTKAEYLGTEITGQTVPNATIALGQDTTDANEDGEFTLALSTPLGLTEVNLTFSAAGYKPYGMLITPSTIPMNVSLDEVAFFATTISGTAVAGAVVNVQITGQTDVAAEVDVTGNYTATVLPIKGTVTVTATAAGYQNDSAVGTPAKLVLGAITVNPVTQGNTSVSGSVAGVNANADDLTVQVITPSNEVTGNVVTGNFNVSGVNTSVAGSASVTVKSAYYADKTQAFTIVALQEIPDPTVEPLVEGAVLVSGTTIANANITLTQNVTTATGLSNGVGAFDIDIAALSAGELEIEIAAPGYITEVFAVNVSQLPTVPAPTITQVTAGDESVSGTTVANATVTVEQGVITGSVVAGPDGLFTVPISGPIALGDYTVSLTAPNYRPATHTFQAIPA